MTDNTEGLSNEQKELVSVGASVGAGCHPCVKHHIKAAVKADISQERLVAALTSSDRIATEATARMATHSRDALGVEPTASAAPSSSLDDALASFGAAVAANDKAAIEAQIVVAQAAGASRSQLQEAIQAAATVQQNAARIHVREAERLVGHSAGGAEEHSATATDEQSAGEAEEQADKAGCDDDCPCHADVKAEPEAEAVAQADREDESTDCGCHADEGEDEDADSEAETGSEADPDRSPMAAMAAATSNWPCGGGPGAVASWPCDQRRTE